MSIDFKPPLSLIAPRSIRHRRGSLRDPTLDRGAIHDFSDPTTLDRGAIHDKCNTGKHLGFRHFLSAEDTELANRPKIDLPSPLTSIVPYAVSSGQIGVSSGQTGMINVAATEVVTALSVDYAYDHQKFHRILKTRRVLT